MLTYPNFIARYPAMAVVPEPRFNIYVEDAVLIMGEDESRWIKWYNQAMAALVAHRITQFNNLAVGSAAVPGGPLARTDVDDVQIEWAERLWDKLPYVEADLYSTVYGQDYVRWRRMAFAGPRIA